jgi:hypothetical protein
MTSALKAKRKVLLSGGIGVARAKGARSGMARHTLRKSNPDS